MDTLIYYLDDTLKELIDRAIQTFQDEQTEFNKGIVQGYCEAINHLLNQAETFGFKERLDTYLQDFQVEDISTGKAKGPYGDGGRELA